MMRKSLLTLSLFLFSLPGFGRQDQQLSYEQIIAWFEPGESEVLLGEFETLVRSRQCHNVTGCKNWEEDTNPPGLTYESDSLWRCRRCTSTRFSSAPDYTIPFPLHSLSTKLFFERNSLKLGFFQTEDPFRVMFSAEFQDTETWSLNSSISFPAFYRYHEPTSCYQVGRDFECKVGNYYSRGQVTAGTSCYSKPDLISLTENELRIEFFTREKVSSSGLYSEYRWILSQRFD